MDSSVRTALSGQGKDSVILRDEREKPVPKRFSVSVGLRPLVRIGITQQPRESVVREEDHLAAVLFDVNDQVVGVGDIGQGEDSFPGCLLYTSPSPRDATLSRMPSSA